MKKNMNRLERFACMLTWMMLTALVAWGQNEMSSTTTTWAGNYTVSNDVTIDGSDPVVVINENTNVTIAADKKLTVNGRIQINNNAKLTILGSGTMIVESSSASGCISGGASLFDTSGSLFIENASVTLRYTGNSSVTSAVSGLDAITLNGGNLYASIAQSAVINETAVLISENITLNGGKFYTNGVANNSSQTFTIAEGKYYKDETTGKRYKGTLAHGDKVEIQGHSLTEATEFYYLAATENDNVTEIWTYIGTGVDTSLPEKRIDVSPNATVSLSIDAKLGYKVTGVTVKGSDNSIVTVNYDANSDYWEFTMPQKDVNVTIETGEATYPELPLTWNGTHTVGTGVFTIIKAYYTFTPTQNAFYKFTTDKPDDVDIFVFDTDTDLTPTSQGYALEAGKTYYVNINPNAGYDSGSTFTLTVTVEGPTALVVTAHKAICNGVSKYWATFYHPIFNYQLPKGVMAFYMKDNHVLYLVGDDGSIIPKKTPVVIMADISTEDTVSLSLSPVDATDVTVTDNVLHGTAAAKSLEAGETVYVMGKSGDNLGFYKYTGTEIPANKAYYE